MSHKAIIQDGVVLGIGGTYEEALADANDAGLELTEDTVADRAAVAEYNQAYFATVTDRVAERVFGGDVEPSLRENEYGTLDLDGYDD